MHLFLMFTQLAKKASMINQKKFFRNSYTLFTTRYGSHCYHLHVSTVWKEHNSVNFKPSSDATSIWQLESMLNLNLQFLLDQPLLNFENKFSN